MTLAKLIFTYIHIYEFWKCALHVYRTSLHYSKYLYPLWFHFLLFSLKEYYINVICCPPWSFTAIFPTKQLCMELRSFRKILICFSNSLPLCMNLSSRFRPLIWCMYAAVRRNVILSSSISFLACTMCYNINFIGLEKVINMQPFLMIWMLHWSNIGLCLHISVPLCSKRCGLVAFLHCYSYCQMVEYWCLVALVHVSMTKHRKIIFLVVSWVIWKEG